MVSAVRKGSSVRAVAKRFGVGKSTVQRWVAHAQGKRLGRVDFSDRSCRPAHTTRSADQIEELVLDMRRELRVSSALGEFGAGAIREELRRRSLLPLPATRTIGRILQRRGALDGKRRTRRPSPPKGWYLPPVASGDAEIDCVDVIEDLRVEKGPLLDVLTTRCLHGHLAQAWPVDAQISAQTTLQCLLTYWRADGLPTYAQFDNDTRFQGAHQHRDCISRVMRLCLALGVTPVFVPPRETGFQAAIENFNRRWQSAVWSRFHHSCVDDVQYYSARFVAAFRSRHAARTDSAPPRRGFPEGFRLDLQSPPLGKLIYLRRATDTGSVSVLGHSFPVDRHWPHRLVRCEVDLAAHRIDFYALRRREPARQPLLKQVEHEIPRRPFHQ
jgi:transposase